MSRIIINGRLSPIGKPAQVSFDPVRGLIVTQEFHSAGNNLGGLANTLYSNHVAFDWNVSPVRSTLRATYSGGQNGLPDEALVNWQLLGNELQFDIKESGLALSAHDSFPSFISDVNKGYELIERGDQAGELAFANTLPAGERGPYDVIVRLLSHKQTNFVQGQFVLKRSYSISNYFNGNLGGQGNVECLLSMGQILGFEMPAPIRTQLASIPIPAAHVGFAWAWRQLPSQMITTANNRIEVSTEWWWGKWSTDLYSAPA
jgi:hypothetical protein